MNNVKELKVINDSLNLSSGVYFLNVDSFTKNLLKININDDSKVAIFIDAKNNCPNIEFVSNKNSYSNIGIINEENSKNINFNGNLMQNSSLFINFADFAKGSSNIVVTNNLKEEGSLCNVHVATVSSGSDNKTFYININHLIKNTIGKVECYGVSKEKSKLTFAGTSYIANGAIKSKTNQTAKAMIFDKESIAIAKPILKIDENDVEASHGAAIGKINDEHLFYLTSRGLSEEQARQIITLGYLKPIINKFDESFKDKIESLIERSL